MDIFGLLAFQGTYASGTTYANGDVVAFSSSSYVSLVDSNVGNQPDTHPTQWALLAAQGATGATGSTGAAGPGASYASYSNVSLPAYTQENVAWLSLSAGTFIILVSISGTPGTGGNVSGVMSGFDTTNSALQIRVIDTTKFAPVSAGVYTLNSSGTVTFKATDISGNGVTVSGFISAIKVS